MDALLVAVRLNGVVKVVFGGIEGSELVVFGVHKEFLAEVTTGAQDVERDELDTES